MTARLLALAVLGFATTATSQKTPDIRIDRQPKSIFTSVSLSPLAAVGESVYAVWEDNRDGEFDIYFNRSLNAGGTWLTNDIRLDTDTPGVARSIFPRIAASGSAVYVAWYDYRNGFADIYFNRSLDNGTTWLASDVRINTNAAGLANSRSVSIAALGSDVYLTWIDSRNGLQPTVYFNRSLDQGTTWLAADVPLDPALPGTIGGVGPTIQATSAGVFVVWRARGIWFNRSLDRGTTWLPTQVQIGPDGRIPRFVATPATLCVVWESSGTLKVTRSLDLGSTWLTPPVNIANNSTLAYEIAAVDSSAYVVYETWGLPNVQFTRSLDGGTTWSTPIEIDRSGFSKFPHVAAEGTAVHVAYHDFRNPPYTEIYYNRSLDSGATWLEQDVRLDEGQSTIEPEIAVANGTPYVAWHDRRQPDEGIWFNIPHGFQPYGAGTAGSGGSVPRIAGFGPAVTGATVNVDLESGVGGAAGAWLIGGPGAKLAVPLLGGTLLVAPSLAVPFQLTGPAGTPGAGETTLPLALPSAAGLRGVDIELQAWILDPGALQGFSMSNGLEMWIGA